MSARVLTSAVIVLFAALVAAALAGVVGSDFPEPAASLRDLRNREVVFLEEHAVYLVYNDGEPLALSSDAQHIGDEVVFCPSSGMFESPAHGEKFDLRGRYYAGPAERGLDRYRVRVQGDAVLVDLEHAVAGPKRGAEARAPRGPFCVPD